MDAESRPKGIERRILQARGVLYEGDVAHMCDIWRLMNKEVFYESAGDRLCIKKER